MIKKQILESLKDQAAQQCPSEPEEIEESFSRPQPIQNFLYRGNIVIPIGDGGDVIATHNMCLEKHIVSDEGSVKIFRKRRSGKPAYFLLYGVDFFAPVFYEWQ